MKYYFTHPHYTRKISEFQKVTLVTYKPHVVDLSEDLYFGIETLCLQEGQSQVRGMDDFLPLFIMLILLEISWSSLMKVSSFVGHKIPGELVRDQTTGGLRTRSRIQAPHTLHIVVYPAQCDWFSAVPLLVTLRS